jgi:hypothetical protein
LEKFELDHINKTIAKPLKKKKASETWAKKTEYTLDSPDFNYPKFKENLEKKKNSMILFMVSAPAGSISIGVFCSDAFNKVSKPPEELQPEE